MIFIFAQTMTVKNRLQFNVSVGETFKVDLYNLPADYDLEVYDPTGGFISGS